MAIDRRPPEDVEDAGQGDTQNTEVEPLLTDAALRPDDPIAGEAARRGADPDLAGDAGRGEEP